MSSLSPKKVFLAALVTFLVQVTASPVAAPNSQYAAHALQRRSRMDIRHTTHTKDHVIDWIPRDSQGQIATPPPGKSPLSGNSSLAMGSLELPNVILGPAGTVPIPQVSPEYLNNVHTKALPETAGFKQKSKRQNAGKHWYVSSNQGVASIGGRAIYSLFKAFVANSGDFSLLQTAVTHGSSKGGQTLEAGWINYPAQVAAPHLFTYYTTNGYSAAGNGIGGWNQDVTGWVQYDSTLFPGTVFTTLSVGAVNGAQYDVTIEFLLYGGNWWLYVKDRWIGYYPASLFSANVVGTSLATGSDMIFYYGEIYQNEAALTTTDMGSGEFGSVGAWKAAYIRNMVYTDSSRTYHDYTATFGDSDSARYNHFNTISSGPAWGSWCYLGGPGAGGESGCLSELREQWQSWELVHGWRTCV